MKNSKNYPQVQNLASQIGGLKALPPLKEIASKMSISRQTLYTFLKGETSIANGLLYSIQFKELTGIDLNHIYLAKLKDEKRA